MSVILETTLGDITVDLYTAERPRTCLNFLKLCKMKYYNFCLVHSVQRNFMIQTGDPLGTGRGGESVFCKLYGDQAKFFESESVPKIKHTKIGTLSMVNNGQDMHGSQFFITTADNLDYLDGVHTVFGELTEGLEVLMKINDTICDEEKRPYKDIRITHTVILDDPYKDPPGLEVPCQSPEPTDDQLRTDRIGVEEDLDDPNAIDMEEMEEQIRSKEAAARATILEMVGDLPAADVKPPENVLFVCKLNPVTTDDDLEVIFSRFGRIASCEVIRDRKSGESLQYAFIEFEREEDCENAFFKMDNVLIDDRRIHVDFSQSVSKLTYLQRNGLANVKPSRTEERDKFVVKDKGRSQGDYQMVFDEESSTDPRRESKKKKKRDHKSSSSDDDTDRRHDRRRRSKDNKVKSRRRSSSKSPYRRHTGPPSRIHDNDYRRLGGRQTGSRDRHDRYDRNSRSDDRSKHRATKR